MDMDMGSAWTCIEFSLQTGIYKDSLQAKGNARHATTHDRATNNHTRQRESV
jgi:hypothetical protein